MAASVARAGRASNDSGSRDFSAEKNVTPRMKSSFSSELFEALPVIGILRGFSRQQLVEIVSATLRGGLTNLEITMNTPEAGQQIREAKAMGAERVNVGRARSLHCLCWMRRSMPAPRSS